MERSIRRKYITSWSFSPTGLLFASTLYLLCNGNVTCSLVHQQLENYAGGDTIFFDSYRTPQPVEKNSSGFEEIKHGLGLVDVKNIDLNAYRRWAGTIGEERVNHIVSKTHRSAYDRAATVLGSLAESMAATATKRKPRLCSMNTARCYITGILLFSAKYEKLLINRRFWLDLEEGCKSFSR